MAPGMAAPVESATAPEMDEESLAQAADDVRMSAIKTRAVCVLEADALNGENREPL